MKQEFKSVGYALLLLLAFCVIFNIPLSAQNITGEIDGTVKDSLGAVVPNAVITVTDINTKQVARTAVTNGKGDYTVPLLPVGTYDVAASAPGFEKAESAGIQLNVGDTLSIVLNLVPGTSTDITVTTSNGEPDLETAENSSIIGATEMKELALNTRNFEQMLLLQPGVSYGGPDELSPGMVSATGSTNPHQLSINGLRPTQLTWLLDGSDILNHGGAAQVAIFPSVDSIEELKVVRDSYGAQYGGGGSAQVLVVTKAGGSKYHGDIYYFWRSQYLDANDFFNLLAVPPLPRAPIRYNDMGYSIGGPLFIPKLYPRSTSQTYFFFSQELRRNANYPTDAISNYPQQAQVNGWFQGPICLAYVYTNGNATCPTANRAVKNLTTPYPGYDYQVPTINSVAAAYIKDVIQPAINIQQPNVPTNLQGLDLQQKSTFSETQELFRLDHKFNDRLSGFFRYIIDPILENVPDGLYRASGYPGAGQSQIYTYGENFMAHATYVPLPNMVLDAGVSYTPYQLKSMPTGTLETANAPDVQVTLPYPSVLGRVPSLSINGGPITTQGPYRDLNHTMQAFENTTLVKGQHTLYFGVNYEHYFETVNGGTSNAGTFSFSSGTSTVGGVKVSAFEQSFANFLTGQPQSFTQSSIDPVDRPSANLYELYAQDNYRITPRLTLDFGVRYSVYGQWYDRDNNLGVFQPEFYNPAQAPAIGTDGSLCFSKANSVCAGTTPNSNYNPLNGIVQAGTTSPYGQYVSRTPLLNFAPRVGFALNVYGDGQTSLRGGYGIFYNQSPSSVIQSQINGNPAYVQNPVFSAPFSFADPGGGALVTTAVQAISGQARNWVTPYTQSYSLDVQQQITKQTLLDVAYVGSGTQHLQGEEDLNQPQVGEYVAAGINNGGSIGAGAPTAELNQIRPYLGWGPIEYANNRFFSTYNSLQTSLMHRFAGESLIAVNYTWSKALANSDNITADAQDRYDLSGEWGPTSLDRRQIFNAHFIYELRAFRKTHGIERVALNGWELSGIINAVSGQWLTVTQNSNDPAGQGILAPGSNAQSRLDMTGDPNAGGSRNVANFFNTNVFELVPAGQVRPGDEKRNSVEGPGYQDWNLDLFKNFELPRNMRFQLRCEAFNAFNHVNYSTVSLVITANDFGQVTAAHEMRILQLGAKLYF